jgi:hypothetical protein
MQFTALDIIVDAYERCNRLSPGETLSADDAAFGFRRLNLLVDEMSAERRFLFRSILTSAAQTGNITLGAGAWAAIPPGDEVISATADGIEMDPLTVQQYNAIRDPASTGTPRLYAHDGFGTIYLYPFPTGQTVKLQTQAGVTQFADQTTTYTAPDGYRAALGASLAVRVAPSVLGGIPPALEKAERKCMNGITRYIPAIVDAQSFKRGYRFNILNGDV